MQTGKENKQSETPQLYHVLVLFVKHYNKCHDFKDINKLGYL